MNGCIETSCPDGLADNNINVFLSYLQIAELGNRFIFKLHLFQYVSKVHPQRQSEYLDIQEVMITSSKSSSWHFSETS